MQNDFDRFFLLSAMLESAVANEIFATLYSYETVMSNEIARF